MSHSIMNVKQMDKIKLERIQEVTRAKDIGWEIKKLKLNYAGHLARGEDT